MTERVIPRREPAFDMPGILVAFIATLLAIQLVRGFLSDTADVQLMLDAGFIPGRWSILMGWAQPDDIIREAVGATVDPETAPAREALARYVAEGDACHPWSILSYALLHGSWMHVAINCVWLAAFGTPVVRRLGAARSVLLAVATGTAGAVAFWIAHPLGAQVVVGASGIVSGFMGAAATFVFDGDGAGGFGAFLRNRSALLFIVFWFVANVLGGLFASNLGIVEGAVAWQAHIGGLAVGLALCPFLDPYRERTR